MNIVDYLGETTEYDKKLELGVKKPKSWLKSVSAFANGIGGALIFGIANDETIVGLRDAKLNSEIISEQLKTKMDPIPSTNLKIHKEDDKTFIILHVYAGIETPYYYVGDGNRIAYVRIGNESVPATAAQLKQLVLKGSDKTFDSLTTAYRFDDFAFTKLRSVYLQRTGNELNEQDFISFGLMTTDGLLTNAGALLADECPLRHSRLFCTHWYGKNKASGVMDAVDDKEYSGSLISLLQNGEEFIKNNTKKAWKKTANGRIELPDIPERAAFECLVNALIHRSYLDLGSEVHIDIYDDRMEIYSPGGMCDGSRVQNLDTDKIPSRRRNPIIADLFNRMHFMERRGSGFKKIKEDYHSAANFTLEMEPVFYSDETQFSVTLYNLNYSDNAKTGLSPEKQVFEDIKTGLSSKKQVFENVLKNTDLTSKTKEHIIMLFNAFGYDKTFARADIMATIGLTKTPASELINKMKTANLIEPISGMGKGKYKFRKK